MSVVLILSMEQNAEQNIKGALVHVSYGVPKIMSRLLCVKLLPVLVVVHVGTQVGAIANNTLVHKAVLGFLHSIYG